MRYRRLMAAALPLSMAAAGSALHAQSGYGDSSEKLFQNSWFWGIHAGGTTIGTPARSTGTVATIGGEWFITRTDGGVYVAYDQSNFTATSAVPDAGSATGYRPVQINNLRTGSIAALAFPLHAYGLRPYAGVGFALSAVGSAAPQSIQGDTVGADAVSRADNARSRFGVFGMGGIQYQIRRTAVFGQVSVAPGHSDFLISRAITMFTGGVRYNFGSSIER